MARFIGDRRFPAQKEIRAATRRDRETWLNGMVASGDWQSVRKLRVGVAAKHGRMQNLNGELVDSSERAETLAEFHEKVQWRVCPPTVLPERPPLWAELPNRHGICQSR